MNIRALAQPVPFECFVVEGFSAPVSTVPASGSAVVARLSSTPTSCTICSVCTIRCPTSLEVLCLPARTDSSVCSHRAESIRWNAGRGRVAADGSRAQDLGARNHIESWHWRGPVQQSASVLRVQLVFCWRGVPPKFLYESQLLH